MPSVQISNFGFTHSIRCGIKEGQYVIGEHMHQFSEIAYVISGSINVTVDGKTENAKKGDIIVIAPFSIHKFDTPEYCKLWLTVFSNDFIYTFSNEHEGFEYRENAVFTPSNVLVNYINTKLVDSNELFIELDTATYRRLKSVIYSIWEEYTSIIPLKSKNNRSNTITTILVYIHNHYKENITLQSVGRALGYNPQYISHCLSVLPHKNFRNILNTFRIEHAKNLLLSEKHKITDIANECGFSGERSFYRTFHSIVGYTPREYVKLRKMQLLYHPIDIAQIGVINAKNIKSIIIDNNAD